MVEDCAMPGMGNYTSRVACQMAGRSGGSKGKEKGGRRKTGVKPRSFLDETGPSAQ